MTHTFLWKCLDVLLNSKYSSKHTNIKKKKKKKTTTTIGWPDDFLILKVVSIQQNTEWINECILFNFFIPRTGPRPASSIPKIYFSVVDDSGSADSMRTSKELSSDEIANFTSSMVWQTLYWPSIMRKLITFKRN